MGLAKARRERINELTERGGKDEEGLAKGGSVVGVQGKVLLVNS